MARGPEPTQGPRGRRATNPRQHHLLVSHTNPASIESEAKPPTDVSIDHRDDAICRRRAASRRQVHCAPPFDRRPDSVRFSTHESRHDNVPRLGVLSLVLEKFRFPFLLHRRTLLAAICGVARGSMPPIGLSLPSFEVTLPILHLSFVSAIRIVRGAFTPALFGFLALSSCPRPRPRGRGRARAGSLNDHLRPCSVAVSNFVSCFEVTRTKLCGLF